MRNARHTCTYNIYNFIYYTELKVVKSLNLSRSSFSLHLPSVQKKNSYLQIANYTSSEVKNKGTKNHKNDPGECTSGNSQTQKQRRLQQPENKNTINSVSKAANNNIQCIDQRCSMGILIGLWPNKNRLKRTNLGSKLTGDLANIPHLTSTVLNSSMKVVQFNMRQKKTQIVIFDR